MSNADTRQAIADAINTVSGLRGYASRPREVKALDAWPQWRGGERAGGTAFIETWHVLIVLPGDESLADQYADQYGYAVAQALEGADVMFVDSIAPALVQVENNGTYALMISGRSE